MKTLYLFIVFLLPSVVWGQTRTSPKIVNAVVESLHSVFGDTIEEGDVFAKVIKSKSTCMTSIQSHEKKIYRHFCHFILKVQDRNWEPFNKCELSCEINYFSTFDDPTQVTENRQQLIYCLESLGEGC